MTPQEWLETAEVVGERLVDLLVQRHPGASEDLIRAFLEKGRTAFCAELQNKGLPAPEIERAKDALTLGFEYRLFELDQTTNRFKGSA